MAIVIVKPHVANKTLTDWVDEMVGLCGPEHVFWCDGSEDERAFLTKRAVESGEVEELDQKRYPGCLYARSQENDVSRVEKLTFICTRRKEDAGVTNNWMAPQDAYKKLSEVFRGSMAGRTMYVVPYIMGIPGSPFSKIGIELTDSIYVVLNMRIMTRMGSIALRELGDSPVFTKGLHGMADLKEEHRFICHFPEDNTIWSVGSNYGGNVLLGKKCLALRIGSWLGRKEGWLAEHMLIMGVEDPKGEVRYLAAAFPSQCGKTNLAMLVPPESMPGWRIWTVGDDIAWLRPGPDGRLWAVNPEAGFFGVAPGTNSKTNPMAMAAIGRNTIFTNVVKTKEGGVWWEGLEGPAPRGAADWRGRPWEPGSGVAGAHPNSRFTAPARQCPCISPEWENPKGVPISAILFGGRRARLDPLVHEAFSWRHGVYLGATMASETTAAAVGKVGVLRRDPMAMLPFCGYDMADYFRHWLEIGTKLKKPPKIFHVNWFRKDADGKFIWPGFGENLRVLRWVLDRTGEKVPAVESPIGYLPRPEDIDLSGTGLSGERLGSDLLSVDRREWMSEALEQETFFKGFGAGLPADLEKERRALLERVRKPERTTKEGLAMQTIQPLLSRHPFFADIHEWYVEQLARYAREADFDRGDFLIREGLVADEFFLILDGEVEIGTLIDGKFSAIQTLGPRDIVGWSWLIPPHKWHFDARASKPVKAVVLDGQYLRAKCEEDPALGYELSKRLMQYVIQRLAALRKRLTG